ncbi:MAG: tetratricopeptide repeat protein [Deltaproteobacteria bacterium]|nr:tetratricopeptide repeat protein [Deltaproteobacteria bacterium]
MILLLLLAAAGCGRMPKVIVLEDPLTAAEHVELGVAYERKGELDLARREYETALRKDRKLFLARFNLGNVFLAKKEYEKARAEYLLALGIKPGDPEAANNLAWCAILSGEGIDDALARMETAVAGPAGRRPVFLDTLGVLRMRANRPEPAAEAFAEAEELCRQGDESARNTSGTAAGETGTVLCPEEVRREIQEHRSELRKRFPPASASPPLVK